MRLLILILLLSGCAHIPTFTDRTLLVRVVISDDHLYIGDQRVKATANPLTTPCVITIEREFYTDDIIAHEFRHCFEGYWHDLIQSPLSRDELNAAYESHINRTQLRGAENGL